MTTPVDDRTAMARAMAWSARVMTVSLEMVLPGLLGVWIDGRLGTKVLFTLSGFAAGLTFAIWHLVKMTKSPDMTKTDRSDVTSERKGEGR